MILIYKSNFFLRAQLQQETSLKTTNMTCSYDGAEKRNCVRSHMFHMLYIKMNRNHSLETNVAEFSNLPIKRLASIICSNLKKKKSLMKSIKSPNESREIE